MSNGRIIIDTVEYGLGCGETGDNKCSEDRVWGLGLAVASPGYPFLHCFSKWNLTETMLGGGELESCSHCVRDVSISKNPDLKSINFMTLGSNQLSASNFSSFTMLDNNADLAINVPCSDGPFWSHVCSNCVELTGCDETIRGDLQNGYRGCQTKTANGRTCQRWTSQSPHAHDRTPENYPLFDLGDHNYCRNPDREPGGIWCYTTDLYKRWEYCDPLH